MLSMIILRRLCSGFSSLMTSSLSCELIVSDLPRGDMLGLLIICRGPETALSVVSGFPGDLASLIGDEALELDFKVTGSLGASKKLPGWSEPDVCTDRLEELLEVLRRS